MRLSAPIYLLKRRAKRLSREKGLALHAAQDEVAAAEGFRRWSHLMASVRDPAERLFGAMRKGDRVILGARPGHGKTLLGLGLAARAARAGRTAVFFTLAFSQREVAAHLARLAPGTADAGLLVDTSDEICADAIMARLAATRAPFAVVDYLQLLDEKRSKPALSEQVETLARFAQASGATLVAISQIDRRYEPERGLPTRHDVRAPNPFDLSRFNAAIFMHGGEIAFSREG